MVLEPSSEKNMLPAFTMRISVRLPTYCWYPVDDQWLSHASCVEPIAGLLPCALFLSRCVHHIEHRPTPAQTCRALPSIGQAG